MSNFNYKFISGDLESFWSFKISEDEKIALIGIGDEEGQLIQFDIKNKKITKSYWTEGQYTLSIEYISNHKAVVGTDNGFVLIIDLNRQEIINKKKISDKPIKYLQISQDKSEIFAITSKEIIAFDKESLEKIETKKLDFNPWHIVLIPNTNILAIEGSFKSVALYKYDKNGFTQIDSVKYSSENQDMISLDFNTKYSLLLTSSDDGYIYTWREDTFNKLYEPNKIDFKGDEISWLQSIDDYITFSTSMNGVSFIDLYEKKITNIPKSLNGRVIRLKRIDNNYYLIYLTRNGISVADIGNNHLETYSINDILYEIDYVDFTSKGDIVAVTSEGVIVSNFLEGKKNGC